MNAEIQIYLDLEIAAFKCRHKYDPFIPKFVFGNDEEYTRLRNRRFAMGPNGPVTMLSAMLRYGLDDTKIMNLFPSPFDLGSRKKIPEKQQSLAYLGKKVRRERKLPDDPSTRKKVFEGLNKSLQEITGRTFREYEDKQNSLKVIYLLDRMMLDPKDSIHGRKERFLTLIKIPTSKFSFEVRSEYPTLDSRQNTCLLNDLKAYLGIEIDVKTLECIESIFNHLIERFDLVREHLDNVAYSSRDQVCVADNYRALLALVSADEGFSAIAPAKSSARLDQDLYIHLQRIEFLHYVGALGFILDKAEPPSTITPIRAEMISAFSTFMAEQQSYYDVTIDRFLLQTFSILAEGLSEHFLYLIEKALGFRPSKLRYTRIVPLAEELLYRTKRFGEDQALRREKILFSFRNIVSALCAVAQAIKFRTTFRPSLFGSDRQRRSIITPLEVPLDREGSARPKEMPEVYLQIWHSRREWVQDALEGQQNVARLKFDLRKHLLTKVVECVSSNDIAVLNKALSALERKLYGVQPKDLHV